nr:lipase 3-like [Onthophagus taurus]
MYGRNDAFVDVEDIEDLSKDLPNVAFKFKVPYEIIYADEILADILKNDGLNILEITKKYGYPFEIHQLTSQDGYIIELHRIPHGKSNDNKKRSAILLTPGLDMGSVHYVLTGNISLGFTLSNAGYDVWIYCTRGTRSSRKHVYLNPDDEEFWKFSFHEVGFYDYPLCIDYIINVTHQPKIFFIGYSQGSTSFGVFLSERPEYNDKIRLAILLASTMYTKHNKHPVWMHLSKNYNTIKSLFKMLDIYEFPAGKFRSEYCNMMKLICLQLVYLIAGYSTQMDPDFIPVLMNNLSGGLSMQMLEHYAQMFDRRAFQKFDYGKSENLKIYDSEVPPDYNISKISAPVALFCGRNDPLVTCEDTTDIAKNLPNLVLKYVVPDEMWSHSDFTYGREAPDLVYKVLVQLLNQH